MSKYFSLFIRIWKLFKPFHKVFYVQLVLISILGAMEVYENVLLGKIINSASSSNFNELYTLGILFVLFQITYWTFDFIKDYKYAVNFSRTCYLYLRGFSIREILKLNISQFQENNSTIKYSTVTTGEERMVFMLENVFTSFLPTVMLITFSIFTLLKFNILITIIAISGMGLVFFIESNFQNKMLKKYRERTDRNIIMQKVSTEVFTNLPLIKTLSIENKFLKEYAAKRETSVELDLDVDKKREVNDGRRNYIISVLNLLICAYAVNLFMNGYIAIGTIYSIFAITNQILNRTRQLQLAMSRFIYSYTDVERYLQLIDLQPEFNEHGKLKLQNKDKLKEGETMSTEIVFTNLTFKYPKGDSNVLENINLTIPHGKRVAFVGHSGSGKTTIVKLLMRAYDYAGVVPLPLREGLGVGVASITIGGLELRDIDSHSLRSAIGYVEQHVDLFDTTVRDNILMSVCEGTLTKWEKKKTPTPTLPQGEGATQNSFIDQKLEEVSRLARIDEFYHRLGEKKWDTEIGERGIKLSGGERQRVGIARAIIKDPSILILDEATSALDTINEKYIKEAVDNVSVGRTTIIIAHRLSTVEDADMIVVMDRGQVVATGTHSNLLLSSTHYQELIEAQLK